jgi:hypothetical protein
MKNEMYALTVRQMDDYIFVQPICDFFEINYENQCRIISQDEILQSNSTKKSSELHFSDKRLRLALTKKGFIRWIQLINVQTVQVTLREKLIEYQSGIFEVMYGSLQRDAELQQKYNRQQEIKETMKKLKAEYNLLDRDVNEYLEEKFGQLRLQLEGGKQ